MKKTYKLLMVLVSLCVILTFIFITIYNNKVDVNATDYQTTAVNVTWDKDNTKYYNSYNNSNSLSFSSMSSWYKSESTENDYFCSASNDEGISVRTRSVNSGSLYAMGIFIPFEVSLSNFPSYGFYNDAVINLELNYVKPESSPLIFEETYPSYNVVLVKFDSADFDYSNLSFANKYTESAMYQWDVNVLNDDESITSENGLVGKYLIPSVKDLQLNIRNSIGSLTNIGEQKEQVISKNVLNNYGLYIYSQQTAANNLNFDLNISLDYTSCGSYEAYNLDTNLYYATLDDAISNSDSEHNNIKIIRSLNNYSDLVINKDVNLSFADFENGSITFAADNKLTISSEKNVTIKGGNIKGEAQEVVACYGNLNALYNSITNNSLDNDSCALHIYEGGHVDFCGQVDGVTGILNEGSGCCYLDEEVYGYDCCYLGDKTAININKGYINLIQDVIFTSITINVDNGAYLSAYAEGYGEDLRHKYYRGDMAPVVTVTCIGKNFTKDKKIVRDIDNSGYVWNNSGSFNLVSKDFDNTLVEEKIYVDTSGLSYKVLEGISYNLTANGDYDDFVTIEHNNLCGSCDFEMTITPKYGYTYPIQFVGEFENGEEYSKTINSSLDKVFIDASYVNCDFDYSITPTKVSVPITYHIDEFTTNENPNYFYFDDADFDLLNAYKEGYIFAGWYTDSCFNNKISKIITDYELDESGNVVGIDLYPCFVKESVSNFLNIQTKSSLKFSYNDASKKNIYQYFGDDPEGFNSVNSEVDFISYAYYNSYGPSMHYFSVSQNYGGVDWYSNSAFIISCNENWTIKKVVIEYRDKNARLYDGYEIYTQYGTYENFDYENLGSLLDATVSEIGEYVIDEEDYIYDGDVIIFDDANVTRMCMINKTSKLWILGIAIELEEQYEITNPAIRFGVDGLNDFDSDLYSSILDDYNGSTVNFGVAINKGANFNPEEATKVNITIDKDNIGDKTFALLLSNVTDFSQLLSACAYVCIDDVYYYAKPITYSINSIATKYLEVYEDDIDMAKYINVLKYLTNAKYEEKEGD